MAQKSISLCEIFLGVGLALLIFVIIGSMSIGPEALQRVLSGPPPFPR